MGFIYGFFCGLLFIPLSILTGLYYFFTYSESYAKKRQRQLEEIKRAEQELRNELEDSEQYASYLSSTNHNSANGAVPEHFDARYQFAGWISVKRTPDVEHRIIEPSLKKDSKKSSKYGKGSSATLLDEGQGRGVSGSPGAAASQDPRFTYLDTQNLHLSLPPCLQARFKDSKYCMVRGAVMFVYENENMLDCLGVITLTNFEVSVPGNPKDGHMFAKRHPLWLKYHHVHHGKSNSDVSVNSSKDYYLSMVSSVDKEDLYFTLLRCTKLKPGSKSFLREIPKRDSTQFDKTAMNTLIRSIHSNEQQFHMAWLNAMIGRVFLGVYKTPKIKETIFQKLEDKLSRIRLPNFLNHLRMRSVHLGDGVPLITRPKLLALKPNGDMVMDMNLLYQGGFRAEIEAEAVVNVTKKGIKVSLVLVVTLDRLEGRLQAWIKPPPSNRIWYGFYHRPQVEMKIEPVVSDKHIKSNLIIKAIENKLMEAISETFVLPNMDDVAFFDTNGVGGIFGEEIPIGGTEANTGPQVAPKSHSLSQSLPLHNTPGPRAATFSLGDGPTNTPRTAIELSHDLRRRTETLPSGFYKVPAAARSHGSLSDELMQGSYNNDNRNKTTAALDDDPMRGGSPRSAEGVQALHVPGGRGIKVVSDGSRIQGTDGSNANRLLNQAVHGHTAGSLRGRRGSLDPNVTLSYSTATSAGNGYNNNAHFPAMEESRKMEENWSQYGISEYEPANSAKKKLKQKGDKNDIDHASVHSKDSGDSTSTHTENTGHSSTLFGHTNSSHSTVDTFNQPHPSKHDKFSLSKMFHGFRKKHTKGSNSGGSLNEPVINGSGDHDDGSIMVGEDESAAYSPLEQSPTGNGASSAREVQEEYEKRDSPATSVYAASLFGGEEHPQNGKLSPTEPHQSSLGDLGAAIRKLRNRPRSGSLTIELSTSPKDIDAINGLPAATPQLGLTGTNSSSNKFGLKTGHENLSIVDQSGSSLYPNGRRRSSSLKETQTPLREARRKSISVPKLESGIGYSDRPLNTKMTATPLIVLQMASPHVDSRSSMDETRFKQPGQDRQVQVLQTSGLNSEQLGEPRSSHSPVYQYPSSPSLGYTFHRHIHVQSHSGNSLPTSPLRNQFNPDEGSIYTSRMNYDEATGTRARRGSDTYSTMSKAPSIPNYDPNDPHQSQHHQHGLRNILTSIGHKHKHKHERERRAQSALDLDPYTNNMDVDVVEYVHMNRTFTPPVPNDDPFACTENADHYTTQGEAELAHQNCIRAVTHFKQLGATQEEANTIGRLSAGLGPLFNTMVETPTQSIMGKAIALDLDEETLQARPGHVGEFPTPVRMHTLLDKAEEVDLALAEKNQRAIETIPEQQEPPQQQRQPIIEDIEETESPTEDINLSHSLPLSSDSSTLRSSSMPLPATRVEAEPLTDSVLENEVQDSPQGAEVHGSYEPPRKDLVIHEWVEPTDENCTHDGLPHEQSNSDGPGYTITRREPPQPNAYAEGPALEESPPQGPAPPPQEDAYIYKSKDQWGSEYSPEEHGPNLEHQQASESSTEVDPSELGHETIDPNPNTKKHHRNIFKRLIGKKSNESLKEQPVYKTPNMSKSHPSLPSLNIFHRHHHNNNQQQQNDEFKKQVDPEHPQGHDFRVHSSLQVPEDYSPHDVNERRPRSNSGSLLKDGLGFSGFKPPRPSTTHDH
ncbi:hypothetical protein BGZ46_002237 [Entomortierella lignicola]|nr:hypothetical protein BGZ46_002237 [Entomortierella lignicola]